MTKLLRLILVVRQSDPACREIIISAFTLVITSAHQTQFQPSLSE